MNFSVQPNLTLPALFDKTITYDLYSVDTRPSEGTVIFLHGFKGFKDWGPWELMAKAFSAAGFDFIKANLSHNGIDLNHDPYEITDLAAFSNNNFSIELDDISRIVTEAGKRDPRIYLIGHSRGGGLSILAASHDPRVKAIITWASPSDFGRHFFSQHIKQWEEEGVFHIRNNRNGQDLPLRYQLYQDYVLNHNRLHIPSRAEKITQPFLAVHGDADETVTIADLEVLKKHCRQLKTHIIKGAGHTFGGRHPWEESDLPSPLLEAVGRSIAFLKELS